MFTRKTVTGHGNFEESIFHKNRHWHIDHVFFRISSIRITHGEIYANRCGILFSALPEPSARSWVPLIDVTERKRRRKSARDCAKRRRILHM